MVMSRKSASVAETAAQVSVRVVPIVLDCTKCRIVALVPADSVSVPVTVWLADKEITFRPAAVMPVNERLLKLLAPLILTVPDEVLVKLTLLKVLPFPANIGLVALQLICEVPEINVSVAAAVSVVPNNKVLDPDNVVVPEPRLIVLEFVLLALIDPAVRL